MILQQPSIIQGEKHGFKKGFETTLTLKALWESDEQLNQFNKEFLLGFGSGFAKAAAIKEQFKENKTSLTYEKKIELFQYLLQTFNVFDQQPINDFLNHIENWENTIIPTTIYEKSKHLLKENKLKETLITIHAFGVENYRLQLLKELEMINRAFQKIKRESKKEEKVALEKRLKRWLEGNLNHIET